jgi:uncharacterized membrane protein
VSLIPGPASLRMNDPGASDHPVSGGIELRWLGMRGGRSASSRRTFTRTKSAFSTHQRRPITEPPAGPPARREGPGEGSPGEGPDAQLEAIAWWWSAPLPPPAQLDLYEQVLPGLAERIVALTEREAAHRHWLDRAFVRYRYFGQWAAVLIALAALGSGVFLVHDGQSAYGFAAILSAIAGLVAVFLVRQFFGNGRTNDV